MTKWPSTAPGAIASLIGSAGDFAIIVTIGRDVPTIDLRVDYLRPAMKGAPSATGRAIEARRSPGVADIEVVGENGSVIAVGRGGFNT